MNDRPRSYESSSLNKSKYVIMRKEVDKSKKRETETNKYNNNEKRRTERRNI